MSTSTPYNPENPDDRPFDNIVEVVARAPAKDDDALVVRFRQVIRSAINSGNSTVWFKGSTKEPTRDEVITEALRVGAIRPPASRSYTGIALDPIIGPNSARTGYVASIEQLDYVFPETFPVIELRPRAEAEKLSDADLIASGRKLGSLAGEVSP